MKSSILLLCLRVLFTSDGRVLAKDPTNAIRYESGNQGSLANDPDYTNDNGVLVLNPTNNLQDANEEGLNQFKEYLENAQIDILNLLPDTRKKKRQQGLEEALATLTGMKLAISPLGEDLERIKSQQIELIRKLKHHDEWKYWAAAEVQKVGDSTNGLRTSEAVSITEDFNNRYALQLRNCVGDFLWEQIRFNLDLSKILKGLQSPTSQLIEAAETCPNTKAKTCRKNVRNAINGLQSAPQDINNLLEGSDQLQETQKQSNQCLDKTLKEYAEERAEVERQLQDIIDEYLESKTPNN